MFVYLEPLGPLTAKNTSKIIWKRFPAQTTCNLPVYRLFIRDLCFLHAFCFLLAETFSELSSQKGGRLLQTHKQQLSVQEQ